MARRRSPVRACALGVVWLALAWVASAQAGLTVSSPGADTLQVGPGATVGFGVRVAADSDRALRVGVEVPQGWSSLLTRRRLEVRAGAGALQLVSVRVPEGTAPGVYPLDVSVSDTLGQVRARRFIQVLTVRSISVEIVDAPRYVVAGEPYDARIVVTNGGNARAEVGVRAGSSQRFGVDLEARRVDVAPGTAVALAVRVATARRGQGAVTDRLRAEAVHRGAPDTTAVEAYDDAYSAVEVVPLTGDAPGQETWPLTMSLSSVAYAGELSPTVAAAGTVALDPDGDRRIEVALQSPGEQRSVFGAGGRAFARYEGPDVAAFAGRGRFGGTSATRTGSFGDGVWVTGTRGAYDGSFHVRRSIPIRRVEGAVARPLDTDVRVGLGRGVEGVGQVSAQTVLGVGHRPGAVATGRVETEMGGVAIDAEAGLVQTGAPVFSAHAARRIGPVSLRGSGRRSDAYQPGRSVTLMSGSAGAHLDLGGVTSTLAWNTRRTGARRGAAAEFVGENRHTAATAAARWSTSLGDAVTHVEASADYQGYRRELLGEVQALGEVLGRTQVTFLSERRTRLTFGAERGRVWDPTTDARRSRWGLRASAGYSGARWSASWEAAVSAGGGTLVTAAPRRVTAGGYASWRPSGRFRLRGRFRFGHLRVPNLGGDPTFRSVTGSGQVDAEVGLPGGLDLVGRAYVFQADGRFETQFQTTLRIPIGVPVPYHVDHPEVVGRIVDRATGEGVEGVMVFLGSDRVVTDRTGEFRFATTEDGGFLVADRASLGADRVPLTDLPLMARPGEPVEIVVGRRVALRGALRRFEVLGTGARADTSEVGGLPYAVVEARGGGRRVRVVADEQGRFVFEDLAAGTYTLRLVRGPVPARHRLEHEALTVNVDQDAEVLWRVLPTQRTIQLLNGGALGGPPRLGGGGDPDGPAPDDDE